MAFAISLFVLPLGYRVPIIRTPEYVSTGRKTGAVYAYACPKDIRHRSRPFVGEQPADRMNSIGEEKSMIHKVIVFNDFN